MGLFNKKNNIEINIKRVIQLINKNKIDKDKKDNFVKQITYNLKIVGTNIYNYTKKHEKLIVPEKKHRLIIVFRKIYQIIKKIEKQREIDNYDIETIEGVIRRFNSICEGTVIYLLRHPEPHTSSYSRTPIRNLSKEGLKEAKRFADLLCEDMLFCPGKICLHILHSKKNRTEIFGKIIAYKAQQTKEKFQKDILLKTFETADWLYAPATHELNNAYEEVKAMNENVQRVGLTKEDRKKTLHYFKIWVENFETAKRTAAIIKENIEKIENIKNNSCKDIFILITHETTIAPLLKYVFNLSTEESFVDTAEFIKIENRRYFIRGRWY